MATIPMYQLTYYYPHETQMMYRNVLRHQHLLPETYGAHTTGIGIPLSFFGSKLEASSSDFMIHEGAEYFKNLRLTVTTEAEMMFLASSFTSARNVQIAVSNDDVFMLTGSKKNMFNVSVDVKMVIYPYDSNPSIGYPLAFFFDSKPNRILGALQVEIVEELIRFVKMSSLVPQNEPVLIPLYEDNTDTDQYEEGDLVPIETITQNDLNKNSQFAIVRTDDTYTKDYRDSRNIGYGIELTSLPDTFKLSSYYESVFDTSFLLKGSKVTFTNTDILRIYGTKDGISIEAHWKLFRGAPELVYYVNHPISDVYNSVINDIISDIDFCVDYLAMVMDFDRPF